MKNICKWCYNKNLGLLILRVVVGGLFIMHGWQKVANMENTVAFFSQIGIGTFWTYVASYTELIAGVLVLLGIFTRYAAALLAIVMIVAIVKVKWMLAPDLFMKFMASEVDILMLASNLCLVFSGPGNWSLAKWCKCSCHTGDHECKVCDVIGCDDAHEKAPQA